MTTVSPRPSPALAPEADIAEIAEGVLGAPVRVAVLKDKPGRRCTWRALGPGRSVIVKVYASDRAATVAARLAALAAGPEHVATPELLLLDERRHVVVLSEVSGRPLRTAILSGDVQACRGAGAAIGRWHTWWHGQVPQALAAHTAEAELATLDRWLDRLPAHQRRTVSTAAAELTRPWPCSTVVHRDLYEEQIILGERVGLIDLDDAAAGPPELDIGNLAAHLELFALRRGPALVRRGAAAVLAGYRAVAELDGDRLARCRRLSLLRLACIHGDRRLIRLASQTRSQLHDRPLGAICD